MAKTIKTKQTAKNQPAQKNIFRLIGESFIKYWKNLHIALPMLIWLVISAFIILVSLVIFIVFNKDSVKEFLEIAKLSQGNQIGQQVSQQVLQLSQFSPLLIKIVIAVVVVAFLLILIHSFFISSTFVFSRNIVNKAQEQKGFKKYFKNSFKYSSYWWKYILVKAIQGLFVIVYLLIVFAVMLLAKNASNSLFIGILALFAIFGYLLYMFILPAPYALVYYNTNLINSFKMSIKNVKRNYLTFFLLNLVIDIAAILLTIIFSLIKLGFIFNYLFLTQFKALVLMLFMKERFKIAAPVY